MSSKAAERRALHGTGKEYWRRLRSEVKRDKWLYLLLLPGLCQLALDDLVHFGVSVLLFASRGVLVALLRLFLRLGNEGLQLRCGLLGFSKELQIESFLHVDNLPCL